MNIGEIDNTLREQMQLEQIYPKIFVQIASYRDPECQWTIKDLFEKATHPERIFVGICWQFIKGEDDDCFLIPYPYPKQVRVIESDARKSNGVCWARSQTQSLWLGEEYTLQIDSHMRFEKGWDETLTTMLKYCNSPKPILTTYPPGYTPPDKLNRGTIYTLRAREFDRDDILLLTSRGIKEQSAPTSPIKGSFCAAGFLFAESKIIHEVPYDPYLYFFGEEINLAVRLWTHGWDFFHPNKVVIFHDWKHNGKAVSHFADHEDWKIRNNLSKKRIRHLLGTEKSSDKAVLSNLESYDLGKERSIEEYEKFAGIDFKKKAISPSWFL